VKVKVMERIRNPQSFGKGPLGLLLALIALAAVLAGCASQGKWTAADQAQMDLGSCGFSWKIADTPEKMKQLEALPQRQIVPHQKDGKLYYIYADARDCKCVYIGDEKAYQQYKQFVYEKRQDRKDDIAAERTADIAMFSDFWNIFGPTPW
jgi:hypothetical protein